MEDIIKPSKDKCEYCNDKKPEYLCCKCKQELCEDCFKEHQCEDYDSENFN